MKFSQNIWPVPPQNLIKNLRGHIKHWLSDKNYQKCHQLICWWWCQPLTPDKVFNFWTASANGDWQVNEEHDKSIRLKSRIFWSSRNMSSIYNLNSWGVMPVQKWAENLIWIVNTSVISCWRANREPILRYFYQKAPHHQHGEWTFLGDKSKISIGCTVKLRENVVFF